MHLALIATAVTVASLWAWGSTFVTACSIAHSILPPWEAFNDFPRLQRAYKLFVYLVGYVALNWRSTLWQSLSTDSGTKPSPVVKTESSKGGPNSPS